LKASRLIQGFDGLRLPFAFEQKAKSTTSSKTPLRGQGTLNGPFHRDFNV